MSNIFNAVILILLGCSSSYVSAQIVFGRVIDSDSGEPVPFANVQIVNTTIGTASNDKGEFILLISDVVYDSIKISCIGYSNTIMSIQDLIYSFPAYITIQLNPFTALLNEVTVTGVRDRPEEFLEAAINAIPDNYIQRPFNMQFYSNLIVQDSTKAVLYQLESIMLTYKIGYIAGAYNISKAIHKRETGNIPLPFLDYMKDDTIYFPYWAGIGITGADQIGLGYSLFNKKNFKKMNFRYSGVSIFDEDTVVAIQYAFKKKSYFEGTIYIASNNLAFIKHTSRIGRNNLEIIYKNIDGYYYPYFIKWKLPARHDPSIYIVDEISLMHIETNEVVQLEQEHDHWFPTGVPYDEEYWNLNRPRKK